MRLTLIVTIILITINSVSALTINEINYNPQGRPDNNKEYIELFSSIFLNLTNYTIEDLRSSDILTLVKLSSSNFYLIVEDDFDYSLIDANIYTIGSTIGNSLNNINDQITIKDVNGTIIDTFYYDSSMGANDNGKSLCRFPNEIGIFNECEQTPGLTNIYQPLPTQNNTTIQSNTQFNIVNNSLPNNTRPGDFKIRINEVFPNPIGDDSQILNEEWIELINLGDKTDINGITIKDSSGKTITISNEITSKPTYINKGDFIVVYTGSKKGFLNNDEEVEIAIYNNDIKIDSISYKDAKEGLSFSREDSNLYYSEPTPGQKNLEKLSEDNTAKISLNSTIMISDTKFEWKTLIVSLDIYKADTNKELIEIWLSNNQTKRVSEISKIKLTTKNQNYSLTIPVILKEDLNSNEIELIVEGLGTTASIHLKTNLSETATNEKSEITTEAVYKGEKLAINNKNPDYGKENKVTYESKRLKSKEYAIYLFIIALIIVTILSIRKHDKN